MSLLRSLSLAVGLFVSPSLVAAECSDLLVPNQGLLDTYSADSIQLGVRSALDDPSGDLRDADLGDYSRRSLARLCDIVPMNVDDTASAVFKLAAEYAALSGVAEAGEAWRTVLFSDALRSRLQTPQTRADAALALRLAAGPEITADTFSEPTASFSCINANAAIAASSEAFFAVQTLYPLLNTVSAAEVCAAVPMSGSLLGFARAIGRLGILEANLPGALADLLSRDFANWLLAGSEDLLLRLVGTPEAVEMLLRQYRSRSKLPEEEPGSEGAQIAHGLCAPRLTDTTTEYYALSTEEIEALGAPTEVQPLLEAFAAEGPAFTAASSLWSTLEAALVGQIDTCLIQSIEATVLDDRQLGLSYRLDVDAANNLQANPLMQPSMPVVQEFFDVSAPTELELWSGIEAALRAQASGEASAEIEAAAEIVAAASEPIAPVTDSPVLNDLEIPELVELAPLSSVTEATAEAIAQSLANTAFIEALEGTSFTPTTEAELMKAQVRSALRPIAQAQIDDKVAREMAFIRPTSTAAWSLTPDLQRAILELPDVANSRPDDTSRDLPARMRELGGIQYPSNRLFQVALNTVEPVDGRVDDAPFSQGMINRITQVARKTVEAPDAPRVVGPFGKIDCGCVPHPDEIPEVYAFYPFWFAPVLELDEVADAETPVPAPQPIDFELVGRAAYYGLEFDFDDLDLPRELRRVTLRHARHWQAAKRDFVNAAHRHRAKVDVAFDLRNWTDWTSRNIEEAVTEIAAQLSPFDRLQSYEFGAIRAALPTLFDTPQPDGVTLIFHGYESNKLAALSIGLAYLSWKFVEQPFRRTGRSPVRVVSIA
ncbi:MAG: hypothetical protein AAF330_03360, partial [Pseudomonadota bacterium]